MLHTYRLTTINQFYLTFQHRQKSVKKLVDYSKVPKLKEKELEIQFVRGWGPGGQATNKTCNAVVLKHKPTNIVVKCHETRSAMRNVDRAKEIMVTKIDNFLNKEESVENQVRRYEAQFKKQEDLKKRKLAYLKASFKEREGIE